MGDLKLVSAIVLNNELNKIAFAILNGFHLELENWVVDRS